MCLILNVFSIYLSPPRIYPPIPTFPLKGGSGLGGGAAARLFQMIKILSVRFLRTVKPRGRDRFFKRSAEKSERGFQRFGP